MSTPFGVAVNSTGTVFASSGLDTTVMVFDAGATTPNPTKTLTGLCKGERCRSRQERQYLRLEWVWLNCAGLRQRATTPDDSKTLSGLNNPQGIAVTAIGRVYVSNGYGANALVYNPDQTTPDPALTLTGSVQPQGIAINDSDTVYLGNGDTAADNILVYNPPTPLHQHSTAPARRRTTRSLTGRLASPSNSRVHRVAAPRAARAEPLPPRSL